MSNIVAGVGGKGYARIHADSLFGAYEKAPQVQICPNTFVHDCRYYRRYILAIDGCAVLSILDEVLLAQNKQ